MYLQMFLFLYKFKNLGFNVNEKNHNIEPLSSITKTKPPVKQEYTNRSEKKQIKTSKSLKDRILNNFILSFIQKQINNFGESLTATKTYLKDSYSSDKKENKRSKKSKRLRRHRNRKGKKRFRKKKVSKHSESRSCSNSYSKESSSYTEDTNELGVNDMFIDVVVPQNSYIGKSKDKSKSQDSADSSSSSDPSDKKNDYIYSTSHSISFNPFNSPSSAHHEHASFPSFDKNNGKGYYVNEQKRVYNGANGNITTEEHKYHISKKLQQS